MFYAAAATTTKNIDTGTRIRPFKLWHHQSIRVPVIEHTEHCVCTSAAWHLNCSGILQKWSYADTIQPETEGFLNQSPASLKTQKYEVSLGVKQSQWLTPSVHCHQRHTQLCVRCITGERVWQMLQLFFCPEEKLQTFAL